MTEFGINTTKPTEETKDPTSVNPFNGGLQTQNKEESNLKN